MKNIIKLLVLIFALFVVIGCGEDTPEQNEKKEYKLQYYVEEQMVKEEVYKEDEPTVDSGFKPEKIEGKVFAGWYKGEDLYTFGTLLTEDVKLEAKFDIQTFEVTFYDETGNLLKKVSVNYGEGVKEEDLPSEEGFKLVEMDKDVSKITSNIGVTCYFKQIYTVTVYDINGEVYSQINVERGTKLENIDYTIEDSTKYKFIIDSWYKDKELTEQFRLTRAVTSDLTLYPKIMVKPLEDTPEGKVLCILGDSISTFYEKGSEVNSYYTGDNQYYYPIYSSTVVKVKQTWWYLLNQQLNTKLGINNSWSGSQAYGSSTSATMSDARINTLGENGTPDIIVIFIGTNDIVNNVTPQNFKVAYETMFRKINAKYPNAHIFGCTLGYTSWEKYYYTEARRLQFNEVVREVCAKNSSKVIELAEVQTIENSASLLGDGLHLNANGMIQAANKMELIIKNYYRKGAQYYNQK